MSCSFFSVIRKPISRAMMPLMMGTTQSTRAVAEGAIAMSADKIVFINKLR